MLLCKRKKFDNDANAGFCSNVFQLTSWTVHSNAGIVLYMNALSVLQNWYNKTVTIL